MAWLEMNLYSNALGMNCRVQVILPQSNQGIGLTGTEKREKYPVLWLLHGASDDDTIWLRRTSIERYAAPLGLAVVMPAVHLSIYTNMVHGGAYMDYVGKELPEILQRMLPLSDKREDNFIAGLSMGGYGCFKIGLSAPERYAAIGSFSSGNFVHLDRTKNQRTDAENAKRIRRNLSVFGVEDLQELAGSEHDLFALAEKCMEKDLLPSIYQVCGTEDGAIVLSREMRDWFEARKVKDYSYKEAPGIHDWAFWDTWIQDFLIWLTEKYLKKPEEAQGQN